MTIPALLVSNNILSGGTAFTGASTTYFLEAGNCMFTSAGTTEANNLTTERTSATLSHVYVNVTSNSRATASTLRSRKNGGNGSQSVSITASTTGVFMDTSNTDSVVATDTWDISLTTGTGTSAQTIASFGMQYDSAADVYTHYRAQQDGTAPTTGSASTTSHFNLTGEWAVIFQSADTEVKFPCRAPGDFSHFYARASANTRSTSTTVGIRKTGSAGNNVVSFSGGTTGIIEDTTPHTDTVTSADKISGYITTGLSTGSITWQHCGAMFKGTSAKTDLVAHVSNNKARGTVSDCFGHLSGSFNTLSNTNEALAQDVVPFACRLSNLRVTAATVNSVNTFKLRVNGIDGNQSVTVSASGVTEDTTSHDDLAANDKINYKQSSAAATTSNWDGIAITMAQIPAVVSGSGSGVMQITN